MESLIMVETFKTIWWIIVVGVLGLGFRIYGKAMTEQWRIRRRLTMQGVKGPPPSLFRGNVPEMQRIQSQTMINKHYSGDNIIAHDYTSSLFPYLDHWRKQYGRVYTYSTGMKQHLYVNHPELVKELNQANTLNLGKVSYVTKRLKSILGRGVITSNGPHWAHQRRIIAPEFFLDKVKGMVGLVVESATPMLSKWEEMVKSREGETFCDIRVDEDLRAVSADVISRACFGSSFSKGKEIFSKLRCLQKAITHNNILFSLNGFTDIVFGPKKHGNGNIEELEKHIESLIWETVKEREKECVGDHKKKDLMQLILEGAMSSCDGSLVDKASSYKSFVVDNCKSIYFAGHETSAVAVSWCLMLLALNPSWQTRIRDEVLSFCKNGIPDIDSISNLKTVTMVIQETLRLYPPAAFVSREALADTKLGNLVVPKGVCLWTLIPTLHRDPEIWGADANEFRPERFSEGVSKACKYPQSFVPFGLGTRLCLGKNFGMMELKVLVSLIVSRFSFTLSPTYQHSPVFRMLVEPQHGVVISVIPN